MGRGALSTPASDSTGSANLSVKSYGVEAAPVWIKNTQTASFPLPAVGNTRFFILTHSGVYTTEALEDDLEEERHHLTPLFYKCHDVITSIRGLGLFE
jgi:hypothetical protein